MKKYEYIREYICIKDKAYIYSLNCPVTGEVKYIGKTINPYKRLMYHIYCYRKSNLEKNKWVKSLVENNREPVMNIIEMCSIDKSINREKFWIKHFSELNSDLLNIQENINALSTNKVQMMPFYIRENRLEQLGGESVLRGLINGYIETL